MGILPSPSTNGKWPQEQRRGAQDQHSPAQTPSTGGLSVRHQLAWQQSVCEPMCSTQQGCSWSLLALCTWPHLMDCVSMTGPDNQLSSWIFLYQHTDCLMWWAAPQARPLLHMKLVVCVSLRVQESCRNAKGILRPGMTREEQKQGHLDGLLCTDLYIRTHWSVLSCWVSFAWNCVFKQEREVWRYDMGGVAAPLPFIPQ